MDIKQTLVGWVACRLGFHLIVTSWSNEPHSVGGGCLRCNGFWQWDNPQMKGEPR